MAAVVLPSEDNNPYFSSSPLRRSQSQPTFVTRQSTYRKKSKNDSPSRKPNDYADIKIHPDSAPSSVSSSPQLALGESDLSYASTPTSNLSLDYDDSLQFGVDPEDNFLLPHYSQPGFYDPAEDLEAPTSPKTGDSYTVSPAEPENSDDTSRPDTPEFVLEVERAEDDTAVKSQPTRHVDYLSHDWREEDIWSSWRYIVSRKTDISNSARLENASWRTWMKAKYNLKTISPETLNWLKDCDVTWLYGPLQTGHNSLGADNTNQNSVSLTKNSSFIDKKPILKKRSMSEIMLQRSLSASSLVKTAAAAVQAQEIDGRRLQRPALNRATTDYITFPFSSRRLSRESSSLAASTTSSGMPSPSAERKHIHFNEQVEQCIAVDVKEEEDDGGADYLDHSDSDEDAIMMKPAKSKKRAPLMRRRTKKASSSLPSEGKTIAMLPSTTLKYRQDTPEPAETAQKHSVFKSPAVSPSPSQETLRPSRASINFFEDDDEAAYEAMLTPRGPWQSQDDESGGGLHRTSSSSNLGAEPAGMRRTSSGMFMPYEDGESSNQEGIFGRVVDTVNTARDIAHVIWNVGWRK